MESQRQEIQKHKIILRLLYTVCDFIIAAIAFFGFNYCRYHILDLEINYKSFLGFVRSEKLILEQIIFPLLSLFIYWISGFYNKNNIIEKSRVQDFINTLYTSIFIATAVFLVLIVDDGVQVHSTNYLLYGILFVLLFLPTYICRLLITSVNINYRLRHPIVKNTLIIGIGKSAKQLSKKFSKQDRLSFNNVIGFINTKHIKSDNNFTTFCEKPVWNLFEITDICINNDVQQVIISKDSCHDSTISYLLENLFPLDISVKIEPTIQSYATSGIKINDILGVPFVDFTHSNLSNCETNIKRLTDIIVSVIAIVMLVPVYLVLSILIKMTSKGSVFYKQERVGVKRTKFYIYKFRSMREDAEIDGPMLSNNNDDRVTKIGKFMRKYRLDEIPQFYNVIKGDMSLVGPRPERKYYIDQIIKQAPYYNLIFQVRPGITSWGMVKFGYASNVSEMVARTKYDLLYINNMSIKLDIKIIIYTFRTIFRGEGL